jgi:hypothetical protein
MSFRDRQDLDERHARGLGRCHDPRRVPRRPLRKRRVRRCAVLRDRPRARLLPTRRPHAPADRFGPDLPDGDAVRPGGADQRRTRAHPGQRLPRLLHPAARSTGATTRSGVSPFPCPVDVAIMLWEWGAYFTKEAIEEGLDVKVSTWSARGARTRCRPWPRAWRTTPTPAHQDGGGRRRATPKALPSTRRQRQRRQRPERVHRPRRNVIYTPPVGASILAGITRDSVITIARDLGFEVREETLPREMLYIADEVFFVGHRRRGDAHQIGGQDHRRPRTARPDHGAIQQRFFEIVRGEAPDDPRLAPVRGRAGDGYKRSLEEPITRRSCTSTIC